MAFRQQEKSFRSDATVLTDYVLTTDNDDLMTYQLIPALSSCIRSLHSQTLQ